MVRDMVGAVWVWHAQVLETVVRHERDGRVHGRILAMLHLE